MLTSSAPLRCTSPADVYLLLKSSDFAMHDLDKGRIFEGCVDGEERHLTNGTSNGLVNGSAMDTSSELSEPSDHAHSHRLELVLKKWYEIERSREVRCFVRDNRLLGESTSLCFASHSLMLAIPAAICQRDPNFFEHLVPQETQDEMRNTALSFWQREIKSKFADGRVTSCELIIWAHDLK